MQIEQIKRYVKEKLTPKRYEHSIYVMEKCAQLAEIYHIDIETAKKVGLAHDVAYDMNLEEKLSYIEENNIKIEEIEKANPKLLHAKIGANIAKQEFEFTPQMVEAIKAHTLRVYQNGSISQNSFCSRCY